MLVLRRLGWAVVRLFRRSSPDIALLKNLCVLCELALQRSLALALCCPACLFLNCESKPEAETRNERWPDFAGIVVWNGDEFKFVKPFFKAAAATVGIKTPCTNQARFIWCNGARLAKAPKGMQPEASAAEGPPPESSTAEGAAAGAEETAAAVAAAAVAASTAARAARAGSRRTGGRYLGKRSRHGLPLLRAARATRPRARPEAPAAGAGAPAARAPAAGAEDQIVQMPKSPVIQKLLAFAGPGMFEFRLYNEYPFNVEVRADGECRGCLVSYSHTS